MAMLFKYLMFILRFISALTGHMVIICYSIFVLAFANQMKCKHFLSTPGAPYLSSAVHRLVANCVIINMWHHWCNCWWSAECIQVVS